MLSLKTTKIATLLLSLAYVVLSVLGLKTSIFTLIASFCAIVAFTLVIAYLDKNNFEEKFIWPLHGFSLHALLFGIMMLFFGVDGNTFSIWYHALLDALVVATMMSLMKQNTILVIVASIITGACSLVNLTVAVQIIFCLMAVLSLITVVRGLDEVSDLGYLIVLLLSLVCEKFVKFDNITFVFHFLFTLFGLVVAFLLLKERKVERKVEVSPGVYEVKELDNKELETAPIETKEIEVETVDLSPIDEVNFTKFTRDWISEAYEKLTLEDLYNSPLNAFKGVGDIMANKMDESLQIKSIKDLANNEFFKWATEILKESL